MTIRFTLSLGLAATAALLAGSARAAGFATAKFGGEHGNPMADNPTAIYYNPAGIALSDGINIFVDGNIAFRSLTYTRTPDASLKSEVREPADAVGANTGKASLFNVVAAPMAGVTAKGNLTDSIGLAGGLAFFVPFGGSATWDKNENFRDNPKYPGAVDGTQRFYAINGKLQTIYISGALALSVKDWISFGVSGGVALNDIDTLRSRDSSGNTDLANEGRAWFKGSSVTPQLGGGIMITPMHDKDKLRIGLSYQAPPNFGRMKVKGLLQKYLTGNLSGNVSGQDDVELHQTLPDIFRVGVSFRPRNDLELRGFFDYTRWSLFDDQCIATAGTPCVISHGGDPKGDGTFSKDGEVMPGSGSDKVQVNLPRRWHDTASVRVGASYWVKQPIELFVGVGYDSAAAPAATLDPSLPDFYSMSTSLGVTARVHKNLAASLGYTQFFYFTRDTAGQAAQMPFPSNGPDTGGVYKQTIGVINVNLHAMFDPFTKHPAPEPRPPNGGVRAW